MLLLMKNNFTQFRPVDWKSITMVVNLFATLIMTLPLLAFVLLTHQSVWSEEKSADQIAIADELTFYADENQVGIVLTPQLAARFAKMPDPASSLKVFVGSKEAADLQPMLGKVKLENHRLVFEPRFAFDRETLYTLRLSDPENADEILLVDSFQFRPLANAEPASVTAIYPSAAELPENLLKFYIHFSAPMTMRDSYAHISLLDHAGTEIELPFLEIEEELWNREGTRFTLLFDPGRVKRGLKPREDSGAPLVAGNDYTLRVSKHWLDARGKPLNDTIEKKFHVIASDYQQPDPKNWKLDLPDSRTREPLSIHFDEALDHALAQHAISVFQGDHPISGTATLNADETMWRLVPDENWTAGHYQLQIDHRLEDHCGNSVGRAFEVDLQATDSRQAPQTITIDFEIARP
jgi:hypothetical protein